MRHHITEEECNKGHMDPEDPGQCGKCSSCMKWIRPKDFNAECLEETYGEYIDRIREGV
jgi:hypothetical protein